jgi:hypothetical protein
MMNVKLLGIINLTTQSTMANSNKTTCPLIHLGIYARSYKPGYSALLGTPHRPHAAHPNTDSRTPFPLTYISVSKSTSQLKVWSSGAFAYTYCKLLYAAASATASQ